MPMFPVVDEDGLPTKGTGGTPGGFTGGGGGGPGGGSFGFGGGGLGVAFAPAGMRGVFGVDGHQRRRLGMPAVPGVTPGAPQPSDTVPAMLTPGEIVMNNGVTSDPQLAQALTHLNMMGAQRMMQQPQGFAFGGMAQGMAQRFAPRMMGGMPGLGMGMRPMGGGQNGWGQQPGGAVPAGAGWGQQPAAGAAPAGAGWAHAAPGGAVPAGAGWGGGGGAAPAGAGWAHAGGSAPMGWGQQPKQPMGATPPIVQQPAGMAYGGMVPGYAYGGHVNPFLMALRYMNMPAGMAYGGMVPGYAFGGGVFDVAHQAMNGMFPGGMSPGGRRGAQPAAGAPSGTSNPSMAGSNGGLFTSNGAWSMVDPRNADQKKAGVWTDPQGNVRNRDGNLLSYDPRNPYSVMSQSYDPTARGVGMRQMGAFGEAGYWDPNGNQALMNSVRGEALANARAQQQGAGLRAQLAGMDPGAAASYRLEAGLRGSSDVARALNNARTQSMLAQQNYANSLAGSLLSNQNQQFTMENQTRNQDLLNNNQHQRERQDMGAQLGGQILGQGLGAFTGGFGTQMGKNLAGGK
jgi:hypothetical protein